MGIKRSNIIENSNVRAVVMTSVEVGASTLSYGTADLIRAVPHHLHTSIILD